ncbi:MAG: DoxX family membrane protein [Candidatus Paceibacterota bacterium]
MNHIKKTSLFLLRVSLGWVMFYAGITKVFNPDWSAKGFLNSAKTFSPFFEWLASPGILPIVDFLNQWGLTLIGLSLLLGLLVNWSSLFGGILMIFYYLPGMEFPYPDPHSFLVDSHVVYVVAFFVLYAFQAGNFWGLDKVLNLKNNK